MNFDNLINDYFSKIYSGNINEFNKFIHNNNLSINITNKNKENALHVVIKSDLSDILKINFIKYLISKNININDKDCVGNTPFNLACQKQLFNIMMVLYNHFKSKINLYDKNNYNQSPISYILKGQIVDEIDNYPSPIKFIKKNSQPQINDVSKLLDAVKNYVKNNGLFTNVCENLIEIIKKNINFELQINKSLVDIKINEFKKKIIENKNDLSTDFKYEFYNDIFNIIKKSHPKTFEPINFKSTKALDDDGFYFKNGGSETDFKIHGDPTFYQNLANVKQLNLTDLQKYDKKFNEIISSLHPLKFFFPFLEEIAHIYYCKKFIDGVNNFYYDIHDNRFPRNRSSTYNECNQSPVYDKTLNDFINHIMSQKQPQNPLNPQNPEYIIRDNTLFKNFTIKIDNLTKACIRTTHIYIRNIVTDNEFFIHYDTNNKQYTYYIDTKTFTKENLSLEIIYNNKLELKLNNISLGTGQFEINFYKVILDISNNEVFEQSKQIDIKTNEYNELIDSFFSIKLNNHNIYNKLNSSNNFDLIHEIIQYYNDNLKIDEFSAIINYLNEELNFPINETYFDKSKFNINYREKILENINNYKSTLLSAINEYELFGKSKLNKNLIEVFDKDLKCDKVFLSNFKLHDDFKNFLNYINKSKKLVEENFNFNLNNFVSYTDTSKKTNYLISPAYQDFYYYFRYHILEKIIIDKLNYNPNNRDDIKNELNKIFDYYDYNSDDHEIKAAKLAVIGDILDHLLINKIQNVIYNEINLFVKYNTKYVIKDIKIFDIDLINMNNEFDLDLSKMNDKIKNVLEIKSGDIKNQLEYNLGNVLINNVEVELVLYYPNNFFDINFNKQQFILYNKKLKNELKDIRLDYDLIKSLIENQNIKLLNNLEDKIILDNNKIKKLIDYIQKNKIDNNKYNYSDFCENYNYHLEEELKKFQNHKNIFKYYNHLIDIFIYFYKSKSNLDNLDNEESLKDDLKDSLENKIEVTDLSDNTEIKTYSKTNIIKSIINKVNLNEIDINDYIIENLEKMLIELKDVEKNNNLQLKKEFISICLAIDLIVGNMYSKLLKRFLLEYLTDKYESEVNSDEVLEKLKIIISNIMTNVDKLINTNFDFNISNFNNILIENLTEFTKKLVILHSEGRYKIKEYVELDEDNLFNEIVNLIKSNSYEKIEEDDIVLTYLKDNINDYFKKYYKLAIKTLIACSSGLNNYILYHNKYNKIKKTLEDKIEYNNRIFERNKKAVEDKIVEKKKNIEIFSKKNNDTEISKINTNYKNKIINLLNNFKKPSS